MVLVYPYRIRKREDGLGSDLLLRLSNTRSAFSLQMSAEQARSLAAEMRGLGTDQCAHHHLALTLAHALGARITCVILKGLDQGRAKGVIRLETKTGLYDVDGVDVAACLCLALHKGSPVFVDWESVASEDAVRVEVPPDLPIPEAFREVIESLDVPFPGEG